MVADAKAGTVVAKKNLRIFIGNDFKLNEDTAKILDAERDLLASVPAGCAIVPTIRLPGACVLQLASGCCLIVQYDIQTDTHSAAVQLAYGS